MRKVWSVLEDIWNGIVVVFEDWPFLFSAFWTVYLTVVHYG